MFNRDGSLSANEDNDDVCDEFGRAISDSEGETNESAGGPNSSDKDTDTDEGQGEEGGDDGSDAGSMIGSGSGLEGSEDASSGSDMDE